MNRGKKKCEILKSIRCQVAKKNGIPYTYTECTYQGECRGTCPKCEEELRYLTRELEKIKQSGKQEAVAGVAAAVIATSTAGCSSDFLADLGLEKQSQNAGVMPAPTPAEQYVTMGVPEYIPPELAPIEDIVRALREGEDVGRFEERYRIQEEWADCLVENGEIHHVFEYDGAWIRIVYDRRDQIASIKLWEQGETLPVEPTQEIPDFWSVMGTLRNGEEVSLNVERAELQSFWADWLTRSGADYDIFTSWAVRVAVVYDGDGHSVSATLYADAERQDRVLGFGNLYDVERWLKEGKPTNFLLDYRRGELSRSWKDVLVERGENYDIFKGYGTFLVTYDKNEWVVAAYLYDGTDPEKFIKDNGIETVPSLGGELPKEYVTAGEPMPILSPIAEVFSALGQSTGVYIGSFERTTIQVEWADWLTESGEDYDVFTMDDQQIIVTYHEYGWSDSVALYAGITTEDAQ